MSAPRRTHFLRSTLSLAALAAGLLASSAHAGLLGGGGLAGGLNGALSPRQLDLGGRAQGNANGSADSSLVRGTLDRTRDGAGAKVGDAKSAASGTKNALATVGSANGNGAAEGQATGAGLSGQGSGLLDGSVRRGEAPAAPAPTSPTPATPTTTAQPAQPLGLGGSAAGSVSRQDVGGTANGQAAGRQAQAAGSASAKASRSDRTVAVDTTGQGAATR